MTFVITQDCCHDASCLSVCPVDCIHPRPDEPDFGTVEMLYVDARSCIDCGACADACPVDAVTYAPRLRPDQQRFLEVNAAWYEGRTPTPAPPPSFPRVATGRVDVAVVGSGPSAAYTVAELLRLSSGRVTVYERAATLGGLVRYGVAPDHPATRRIGDRFAQTFAHPRVTVRTGVELGRDVTVDQLRQRHDAVVVAVGAGDDRVPDLPGWGTARTLTARQVVGWYNGEPSAAPLDLGGVRRIAVIGTGNVALDVARVLISRPDRLAGTAIDPAAAAALAAADVREVAVVGRGGPERAAWSHAELEALRHLPGVALEVLGEGFPELPRVTDGDGRRIVLAFGRPPTAVTPSGLAVEGGEIPADLVVAATGYRGRAVPGLPFDDERGVVPNDRGRVGDGTYVVGWIKRGPSGGIGANRRDAEETVATLLGDLAGEPR